MKLHLSTGGERCVNPFENLNSFMPLALPSWTYPRLKFSSILQFEKKNRSRRRIRGDRRFGGDELDNLLYESMVRERGFARFLACGECSLPVRPRSFNRALWSLCYLFPRTAYAGFSRSILERMLWQLRHWFLRAPNFHADRCPGIQISDIRSLRFSSWQGEIARRAKTWILRVCGNIFFMYF